MKYGQNRINIRLFTQLAGWQESNFTNDMLLPIFNNMPLNKLIM
jgi:hypothetical protein